MKNRKKKWLFALLMACSVAVMASGCDKLKKEPETEAPTEAPTEKPTEAQTETEPQTEAPTETEPQTEAPTETEPQTEPKVLTVEEEKAQETQFDQLRTMYAMDDVNVRAEPGTGDDVEIFSSFYQGDRVTVVGETPNWCVVEVEDYDTNGYVSKQFLSDTEVAAKTDEEREQLILQELGGTSSGDGQTSEGNSSSNNSGDGTSSPASSSADTSAIDSEFGVEKFAESYQVYAMTGANLRAKPSQDGEIIQTIASGSGLTAVGYTDRWYKVESNGTVGYVNKNLFSTEPVQ
ncbi:MAG: SH3 domain-containing protein [Lachnospiraceae bacterium]|nr:SH3 domain-containing protein [Lachnospiraceae bacterium]